MLYVNALGRLRLTSGAPGTATRTSKGTTRDVAPEGSAGTRNTTELVVADRTVAWTDPTYSAMEAPEKPVPVSVATSPPWTLPVAGATLESSRGYV